MRLHRFRYSPYARKVQMVLELMGEPHEVVEVPYGERNDLARLTGGYVYVPVLEMGGEVLVESRAICERLLALPAGRPLVPAGLEGPVWGFADFLDGPAEDILFRIASPAVRDAWKTPWERALYVLVKERKFGAGCVDAWERDRDTLIEQARKLLSPTATTLSRQAFLFGERPTFADAALYGQWAMLEEADASLLPRIDAVFVQHARRVEEAARAVRSASSDTRRRT